jgi:hypothetical protein
MEPGFIADRGHFDVAAQQEWVEGAPEKSFWTGLKTKGRESHEVLTYRCERCGLLESYAGGR